MQKSEAVRQVHTTFCSFLNICSVVTYIKSKIWLMLGVSVSTSQHSKQEARFLASLGLAVASGNIRS
jgi:hypothetical protein